VIDYLTVSLGRLPEAFDGLRIAVIADLHAGRMWRRFRAVQSIVELVNAQRPNIVLLLGDIVHHLPHAAAYLDILSGLHVSDSICAVLGNHEHAYTWSGVNPGGEPLLSVDDWRELYAQAGIRLMVNQARSLCRGQSCLWLVGIDDRHSKHDDLRVALDGVPEADCCIGFTHHPDLIDDPLVSRLGLLLAGHTHGGQVRLPMLGLRHVSCKDPEHRATGWVRENGTRMYVTRGAGEGIPIRIGCPRQIPIVTLRAGDDPAQGPQQQ